MPDRLNVKCVLCHYYAGFFIAYDKEIINRLIHSRKVRAE